MQSITKNIHYFCFLLSLAFVSCWLTPQQAIAQATTTPKAQIGFDGQVAILTDGESVFMNFGGPGIRMKSGSWAVSANMLPSLRFYEDPKKINTLLTPSLGAGLQLYYKRLILCGAGYYLQNRGQWTLTGGVGFKLSK